MRKTVARARLSQQWHKTGTSGVARNYPRCQRCMNVGGFVATLLPCGFATGCKIETAARKVVLDHSATLIVLCGIAAEG